MKVLDLEISLEGFPGCCGLSVLFEPNLPRGYRGIFTKEEIKEYADALKDKLDNYFGAGRNYYEENVGSVMMTDVAGGFLYKICRSMGLKAIHKTRNPKTNNIVYVFVYRTHPLRRGKR